MNRKLIFLLVLLIPGLYALDFWYQMTHQYAILEHEFEITAETEFIPELIDNVVIGDDFAHFSWKLYLKLLKYDRRLKAGNYQSEGDTVSRHQLIQHILSGPNKK
jgi:cell division protein YceG involved in septum cleavage